MLSHWQGHFYIEHIVEDVTLELEPYLIPEITPLESPFTYPKCVILGKEPSSSSWLEPLTETDSRASTCRLETQTHPTPPPPSFD